MHYFGIKTAEDVIKQVDELRARLADVIKTDQTFNDEFYLLQWLKRHQFKLDRIEAYIRESIIWRKETNFDGLAHVDVHSEFPGLAEEFPINFEDVGNYGQPIFTFNGDGIENADAIFKQYGYDMVLRYIFYCFARAEYKLMMHIQQIKAELKISKLRDLLDPAKTASGEGNDAEILNVGVGSIAVISFKGVSLWNVKSKNVIRWLFEAARVGTNYFPIFLTTAYVINIHKVATLLVKLIKPIISSPAFQLKLYDTDRTKWIHALAGEMEEKILVETFPPSNDTIIQE